MAASRATTTTTTPSQKSDDAKAHRRDGDDDDVQVGVSASVGHDNWASRVLDAVTTLPVRDDKSPPMEGLIGPKLDWIGERVLEKKRKFHSGRSLELKNLPDGCTEQDVRDAFPDLAIVSVLIERTDGRIRPGAKITLERPEALDEWPKSRQTVFIRNKEVSVCVGSSDGWLCLAKMPLNFSEQQFLELTGAYGKVKEAFLMISEQTGESKGYGLIKYSSSEAAAQARHLLDGRVLANNYVLDCDWLNAAHVNFSALHSKALYVDHLPSNYRDMGEFRRIFSVVRNPPYCQIAMPKGVIQDWGLVEFFDPKDSEETQRKLDGHQLRGKKIRVHFCIPGVNAINIYMQAVNAPSDRKKKALLNDTPSANVYTQLQKLAGQNPNFAQNLQNIITEQIQSLSSGKVAKEVSKQQQQQQQQQQQKEYQSQQIPPTMVAAAPTLDSNAQAALMILLTAQMQSQAGEASLLQNPQVVGILQNLVNGNQERSSADLNEIMANPALSSVFGKVPTSWTPTVSKGPVLIAQSGQEKHSVAPKDTSPTPPIIANNLNSLLNTQNLNELLGSLSTGESNASPATPSSSSSSDATTTTSSSASAPAPVSVTNQRTVLLSDPPSVAPSLPRSSLTNGLFPAPLYQLPQQQQPQQSFYSQQNQLPVSLYQTAILPQQQQALLNNQQHLLQLQQQQQQQYALAAFQQHHQQQQQQLQQQQLQQHQQQLAAAALMANHQQHLSSLALSGYGAASVTPTFDQNGSISMPFPSLLATPPSATGKRKLAIPPSPEQSPEGNYIGQHSQGLGGHYADSYWRLKRAKFN